MKHSYLILLLGLSAFMIACSPHPASGVWQTADNNDYGISKVIVGFDGRASFTTQKSNNAEWHCFWSANDKEEILLTCTSSANPEAEEYFTLSINNQRIGELKHSGKLISHLTYVNENPSLAK